MFTHGEAGLPKPSPVGFVLARDALITLRYDQLASFQAVAEGFDSSPPLPTAFAIFIRLCEEIVDHLADSLEQVAARTAQAVGRYLSPPGKS